MLLTLTQREKELRLKRQRISKFTGTSAQERITKIRKANELFQEDWWGKFIPGEILAHIFQEFSTHERIRLRQVCRTWRDAAFIGHKHWDIVFPATMLSNYKLIKPGDVDYNTNRKNIKLYYKFNGIKNIRLIKKNGKTNEALRERWEANETKRDKLPKNPIPVQRIIESFLVDSFKTSAPLSLTFRNCRSWSGEGLHLFSQKAPLECQRLTALDFAYSRCLKGSWLTPFIKSCCKYPPRQEWTQEEISYMMEVEEIAEQQRRAKKRLSPGPVKNKLRQYRSKQRILRKIGRQESLQARKDLVLLPPAPATKRVQRPRNQKLECDDNPDTDEKMEDKRGGLCADTADLIGLNEHLLNSITSLDLSWTRIAASYVEEIVRSIGVSLKSLKLKGNIHLYNKNFEGLGKYAPKIQQLDIEYCHRTVEGIHGFAKHLDQNCLTDLTLSRIHKLNDLGVALLLQKCGTALKKLKLSQCISMTNNTLIVIATHNTNLEELTIDGCTAMNDTGIKSLGAGCSSLKKLGIRGLEVSDEGIRSLFENKVVDGVTIMHRNSTLTSLDLRSATFLPLQILSDATISTLSINCPNLQKLRIGGYNTITQESIEEIMSMQNLSVFEAEGMNMITPEYLEALHNPHVNPKLTILNIRRCPNITAEQVEALEAISAARRGKGKLTILFKENPAQQRKRPKIPPPPPRNPKGPKNPAKGQGQLPQQHQNALPQQVHNAVPQQPQNALPQQLQNALPQQPQNALPHQPQNAAPKGPAQNAVPKGLPQNAAHAKNQVHQPQNAVPKGQAQNAVPKAHQPQNAAQPLNNAPAQPKLKAPAKAHAPQAKPAAHAKLNTPQLGINVPAQPKLNAPAENAQPKAKAPAQPNNSPQAKYALAPATAFDDIDLVLR